MPNILPAASDFMESADSQSALSVQSLVKSSQYNSMALSLTQQQWSAVATLSNKKIEDLPEVSPAYLKRLRLKSKLSQQAFAEKLKVHISTVTRWEAEAGDVEPEEEEAIAHEPLTLTQLIKRQGLTISSLAEKMGLTNQTIGNWTSGRSLPSLSPAQTWLLLKLLNCSLEELAYSVKQNIFQNTIDK